MSHWPEQYSSALPVQPATKGLAGALSLPATAVDVPAAEVVVVSRSMMRTMRSKTGHFCAPAAAGPAASLPVTIDSVSCVRQVKILHPVEMRQFPCQLGERGARFLGQRNGDEAPFLLPVLEADGKRAAGNFVAALQ